MTCGFNLPTLPKWLLASMTAATIVGCTTLKCPSTVDATGIDEGILSLCSPARIACISSQDDIPVSFLEPFEYDSTSSRKEVEEKLKDVILLEAGSRLIEQRQDYKGGTYIRFEIKLDFKNGGGYDDIELFLPTDDNVVHFKSESRNGTKFDAWRNRNRMKSIRINAHLDSVPVLRGRSSILGLFESPFDSFGPTVTDIDTIIERGGISSRPR